MSTRFATSTLLLAQFTLGMQISDDWALIREATEWCETMGERGEIEGPNFGGMWQKHTGHCLDADDERYHGALLHVLHYDKPWVKLTYSAEQCMQICDEWGSSCVAVNYWPNDS
jgi:hypothetical protein